MFIKSIVIKRRTLGLAALAVLGICLIGLGWYSGQTRQLSKQVNVPLDKNNSTLQVNNSNGLKENSSSSSTANEPNAQQKTDEVTKDIADEKPKKAPEYFVENRLQREKMRGQRVELLREIINNPSSAADTRQKAQDQLLVISSNINKETEAENLIRAKGFKDCAVFLQNQSVTVIVQAEKISPEEAAKISDIVARSTGISLQNIVIIPKA